MQKILNIFLILAVIALGILVFMQYRAIQKLTPQTGAADSSGGRSGAGDWIDQLSQSAKNLNIEVKY